MDYTPSQPRQPPGKGESYEIWKTVFAAIAESNGTSPLEVRPPLATVLDPETLDDLVTSMDRNSIESTGRVEFTYSDHHVTVTSAGAVSVSERRDGD